MKFDAIVDRIEGNQVVLLPGSSNEKLSIPINFLPREIQEGDVLKVSFEIDPAATERAKEEARDILAKLLKIDEKNKSCED